MKNTLLNGELVALDDDLAAAVQSIKMDAKKKAKKAMAEMEMEEEGEEEDMEDSMDSDDSDSDLEDDINELLQLLIEENEALSAVVNTDSDDEYYDDEDEEEEEEEDEEYYDDEEEEYYDSADDMAQIEEFVTDNLEVLVTTDAIEEYVKARLDSALTTYEDAKPFLPADFKLSDHADAVEIKEIALRHSLPKLDAEGSEFKWDSVDAIDAAFSLLSEQTAPAIRNDMGYKPLADKADMGGVDGGMVSKKGRKRRKPSYSVK